MACGEHFGRHETNPHWVAVCTLPAGHDGDHDNVLSYDDRPYPRRFSVVVDGMVHEPSPDTAADRSET